MRSRLRSCFWDSSFDHCRFLAYVRSIHCLHAPGSGNYQVPLGLGQTSSGTMTPREMPFVKPITTLTASSIFQVVSGCDGYNIQPENITAHLPCAPKPLTSLTEPKVTFTQILFKMSLFLLPFSAYSYGIFLEGKSVLLQDI